MHAVHPVVIPRHFPSDLLPQVCAISGRTDARNESVTLTVASSVQRSDAVGVLTLVLSFGRVAVMKPYLEEQVTVPLSPRVAERDRREEALMGILSVVATLIPVLIAGAIYLINFERPRIAEAWYLLPLLLFLGGGAGFCYLAFLGGQPSLRCVDADDRAVTLELPSQESAEAIRAAVADFDRPARHLRPAA